MSIKERVRRGLSPLLWQTAKDILWDIANGKPANEDGVAKVISELGEDKFIKAVKIPRTRIAAAAVLTDCQNQQPLIDKAERENATRRKNALAEIKKLEQRIVDLRVEMSDSHAKCTALAGDVGGQRSTAIHTLRSTADPEIARDISELRNQINELASANMPTPLAQAQYATASELVTKAPEQIKRLQASGTSEALTQAALLSARIVAARAEIQAYLEKQKAREGTEGEIAALTKKLELREADVLNPANFRLEM